MAVCPRLWRERRSSGTQLRRITMQIGWYKNFFYGVALDLWRKAITPEQTRAEVDFLVKTLRPPEGARLLDVPCGGARHSLPLSAPGFRVGGVELLARVHRAAPEA